MTKKKPSIPKKITLVFDGKPWIQTIYNPETKAVSSKKPVTKENKK